MFPTLFDKDFKEVFQNPILRRFPSLPFEELLANQKGGLTISEGTNDITILADMPGLDAKDIEVKLENGLLQIKGEKKEETTDEERRYYSRAVRSYRFTVDLPVAVDDESKIEAFTDKGVMHIVIPKSSQSQAKKITVHEKEEKAQLKSQSTQQLANESVQKQQSFKSKRVA